MSSPAPPNVSPNLNDVGREIGAAYLQHEDCMARCQSDLQPLIDAVSGGGAGASGGLVVGGLGTALVGAFAGGTLGLVNGSVVASQASVGVRGVVGASSGAVVGANVWLLQGGTGGTRAVAGGMLEGVLGATAPAAAGSASGVVTSGLVQAATSVAARAIPAAAAAGIGWYVGNRTAVQLVEAVCESTRCK